MKQCGGVDKPGGLRSKTVALSLQMTNLFIQHGRLTEPPLIDLLFGNVGSPSGMGRGRRTGL